MQERKNKYRFILLMVLTITTLAVFWLGKERNAVDLDDRIFQLDDFKTIDRVMLDKDTGSITLAFNGTTWRVNDRYDADGNMINVLFATLQQARPKRSVGSAREDSIYDYLSKSGVKVSLFEGDAVRKYFFTGGNQAKTQAFFADPDSKAVYVMAIPGYRVYVSGIFEMGENGWRDKIVFGFNWRNFRSLEARYPQAPSDNFVVSLNKGYFGIEGLETDTVKLNTFFDHLFSLTVDDYLTRPRMRDSLKDVSHFVDFTVTDVANRSYRLTLFSEPQQPNVLGIIQDSDVGIFSRRKIQPLLRPKSFFKKK
jgi:hypothetical protein